MQSRVRTMEAVSVLELGGKITIGEGEVELRSLIEDLLKSGHTKIVISLEKVGFMDSAGLGELVACYKRATDGGGVVKLLKPAGKVADLLSLTRITEIFEIYHDEGEALASF